MNLQQVEQYFERVLPMRIAQHEANVAAAKSVEPGKKFSLVVSLNKVPNADGRYVDAEQELATLSGLPVGVIRHVAMKFAATVENPDTKGRLYAAKVTKLGGINVRSVAGLGKETEYWLRGSETGALGRYVYNKTYSATGEMVDVKFESKAETVTPVVAAIGGSVVLMQDDAEPTWLVE